MKDLNNKNNKTFGRFSIVLMIFIIMACASGPINVELPAHHPANPKAQEAEFIPPPNPFKEGVTAMNAESTSDSIMMDKSHDEKNQKHMHQGHRQ